MPDSRFLVSKENKGKAVDRSSPGCIVLFSGCKRVEKRVASVGLAKGVKWVLSYEINDDPIN